MIELGNSGLDAEVDLQRTRLHGKQKRTSLETFKICYTKTSALNDLFAGCEEI